MSKAKKPTKACVKACRKKCASVTPRKKPKKKANKRLSRGTPPARAKRTRRDGYAVGASFFTDRGTAEAHAKALARKTKRDVVYVDRVSGKHVWIAATCTAQRCIDEGMFR